MLIFRSNNPKLPSTSQRWRPLRQFPLMLLLSLLCLGSLSTASCRDVSRMCQKYVKKYQMCTQQRYKQAVYLQSKLPPQSKKRSEALLQQLQQQLQSPEWHKRHMRLCTKSPPNNKRFRCVYQSSCASLSQCNPQASKLTPQDATPPKRR